MKVLNLHRVYKTVLLTVLALFVPSLVQAEDIQRYEVEITAQTNATFDVVERISYDYEDWERHGIFRDIPLTHSQPATAWYKKRYIEVSDVSVTRNGESEPFTRTELTDELSIKIGDPDVTISGLHEYEIRYSVAGGLSYYREDLPEIYWDAIGHEWEVPIRQATVILKDPHGIFRNNPICYRGRVGETGTCGSVSATTSQVTFTNRQLSPGEAMTVAQSVARNKVPEVLIERTQVYWFWVPAAIVWLLIVIIYVYRYRTAWKPNQAVIPQYEPFEDFKPMFTGLLVDGRLDPRDITAGIVYLAEQGFIKITQTEKTVFFVFEIPDYKITLLRDPVEIDSFFLENALTLLFGYGPQVGTTVTFSEIKTDIGERKRNQKILQNLKEAALKDLTERGFFESNLAFSWVAMAGVILLFFVPFWAPFTISWLSGYFFPVFVMVCATAFIVGWMYKRRTKRGYNALWHLKGFKQFLSVTDKERFAFHNAPSKNPQQFLEYLPYAIAFGVEREWAEVFKDITIPSPEWYSSSTTSVAAFSATDFTHNLSSFSQSFSQSSGASGASGGGSAGGGSGGGGGGSW